MRFSVIVPVYKVEPYLRQCVDSILGQTCRDFELILVDDGSPDRCPAICDEYAALDRRVKVIHKPNGGLVSARQAGLEIAQGEYIVPIDSDDWIALDFLAEADKLLEKYHVEMVCFGHTLMFEDGRKVSRHEPVPEGLYEKAEIEKLLWPRVLCAEDGKTLFPQLWGKVYKKELIEPHQMAVDRRIAYDEDKACLIPTYLAAQKIYISNRYEYFYRIRMDSMSNAFQLGHLESIYLFVLSMSHERKIEEQLNCYIGLEVLWQIKNSAKIKTEKQKNIIGIKRFLEKEEINRCIQNAIFKRTKSIGFKQILKKIYLRTKFLLLRWGWVEYIFALVNLKLQIKKAIKYKQ